MSSSRELLKLINCCSYFREMIRVVKFRVAKASPTYTQRLCGWLDMAIFKRGNGESGNIEESLKRGISGNL